jgi:Thymidylate synthase
VVDADNEAPDRGPADGGFEALYYPELLHPVNPTGDVGLITLWSPFRTVERKLAASSPEILDPRRSRLAVIANLYGDGLFAMLCNLLFNPQIRHLVAIGEHLDLPTRAEIAAFLEHGLADDVMLGLAVKRVRGTERVFPVSSGFDEARLRESLSFRYLGKLSRPEFGGELTRLLGDLPLRPVGPLPPRLRVEIPTAVAADHVWMPSESTAHQVVRRRPLDCWEELIVRVVRFGRPVELATGPRLELLNARAVITDPADDPERALAAFGFDLALFRAYQTRIFDPELPEGISYTYGNRLRGYFDQATSPTDTLQTVIEALCHDRRTRGAYVSVWDSAADLPKFSRPGHPATPCLTTLFFRTAGNRLTVTATYRAHNLLTAWLENVYGLMAIQRHVASATELDVGPITVLSHSLGIDPRNTRYELARKIATNWKRDDDIDRVTGKFALREDPAGYFVVTVDADRRCIVAEHRYGGVLVKRYESDRATSIEQAVAADMAVTLVSHALWLGRELTLKEGSLRGRPRP